MNILVLEDRGSVSYHLKEALEGKGHTVFRAFSISDAQHWLGKKEIEYLIVDLNMSPEGLREEEIDQTKDGLLTGWVWLNNHVYPERPSLKRRTIILSEYIDELSASVQREALEGIQLVAKRGSTSPTRELFKHVKSIADLPKGEDR